MTKRNPELSVAQRLRRDLISALDQENWPQVAKVDARIQEMLRGMTPGQKKASDVQALKDTHKTAMMRVQKALEGLQEKINSEHKNRDGLRAYHGLEK